MNAKIFLFFTLSTFFLACKKDPPLEQTTAISALNSKVTEYFPLIIGSYWIYDRYSIDTNLVEFYKGLDTIKIVKDSIINGRTFSLQEGTYFGYTHRQWLTDSADYIIHDDGHRLFSHTNFNDTLMIYALSNYSISYYKMINRNSLIQVPAGTFTTIDRDKITYYIYKSNAYVNPSTSIQYFSKSVGLVKEQRHFENSPKWWERRLITYYIAP